MFHFFWCLEAQTIVNKGHHVFMGMGLKIGYEQGSHPLSAGHSPRLPPSSATHSTGAGAPTTSMPPIVSPLSSATHSAGIAAPTTASLSASATSPLHIVNPLSAVSTTSISGQSPGAIEAGQPNTTSIREIEEAHTNSELTSQLDMYYDDRLMVVSMPSDWNDTVLGMEIEDTLDISDEDYKVKSLDNGHLLVLSKHYTEQGTCMCKKVYVIMPWCACANGIQ